MRLTPRSSRALDLARHEARALGAPAIGTAHLLLGLVREGRECADPLLADVDPERVRGLLPLHDLRDVPPPLSPGAATAIAAAARSAVGVVGVPDLIVAVLGMPASGAAVVLERLGVDPGHVWVRAGTPASPVALAG